jgi:uncharacterized protein YceK
MTQANALCGRGLVIRMKRTGIFLCSVAAAVLMTGCGAMPDLTQEETDLISEYAVGVLLKYDANNSSRLVDTSAYDEEPVVKKSRRRKSRKQQRSSSRKLKQQILLKL